MESRGGSVKERPTRTSSLQKATSLELDLRYLLNDRNDSIVTGGGLCSEDPEVTNSTFDYLDPVLDFLSMNPGETQLTVIPRRATSLDSDLVSATMPAFAAA